MADPADWRQAAAAAAAALAAAPGRAAARTAARFLSLAPREALPVGGLDAQYAGSILYVLRCASASGGAAADASRNNDASVEMWLHALQLAQLVSDRLLASLRETQRCLNFWIGRQRAGPHAPLVLAPWWPSLTDALIALASGGPATVKQEAADAATSDRMEERIAALSLLSACLAEALAHIHAAAALLRLQQQPRQTLAISRAAAAATAHDPASQSLQLPRVRAAVSACLLRLQAALQRLSEDTAPLQDRGSAGRVLHGAGVSRVTAAALRVHDPTGPVDAAALRQQLLRVAADLSVKPEDLSHGARHGDAGSALAAASALAAQAGGLVPVPRWARMPSALQRHWLRSGIAAGVSVATCVFLYRHSRLSGSRDLDEWATAAAAAVKGAWHEHVLSPLVLVRDELFATLRSRPSIVNSAEFESDKQSLLRMLAAFERDHPELVASAGNTPTVQAAAAAANSSAAPLTAITAPVARVPADTDAINRGMQAVMQCYEAELRSPIRNTVAGDLARTLLIQIQRLKLDTEAAMLELDQILRANELSISLVAAVPALLLGWTLLRGLWLLLLSRRPPDPRREAMPCRLAMADLERALTALVAAQQSIVAPSRDTAVAAAVAVAVAEGKMLFQLHCVAQQARSVYRLKDRRSRYSEWPHLQADLLELAQPGVAASDKLDLLWRMLRTYTVLQP